MEELPLLPGQHTRWAHSGCTSSSGARAAPGLGFASPSAADTGAGPWQAPGDPDRGTPLRAWLPWPTAPAAGLEGAQPGHAHTHTAAAPRRGLRRCSHHPEPPLSRVRDPVPPQHSSGGRARRPRSPQRLRARPPSPARPRSRPASHRAQVPPSRRATAARSCATAGPGHGAASAAAVVRSGGPKQDGAITLRRDPQALPRVLGRPGSSPAAASPRLPQGGLGHQYGRRHLGYRRDVT